MNDCIHDSMAGRLLSSGLLGSITAVVPAASGATIEYRSYDAWGRVRNPSNWSFSNVPVFSVIDRGYTFHEHLPESSETDNSFFFQKRNFCHKTI